ncbi:MAG: hypothetical protein K6E78_07080, partial [Treponema sp.]|nr:hypothetical protein [Treponema sp.]
FGDIYDVKTERTSKLTVDKLNQVATSNDGTTFVLGRAPNCYGGHWVLLEGYHTNSEGVLTFDFNATSDNDIKLNRTFVYGEDNQNKDKEIFAITEIQTYTFIKK